LKARYKTIVDRYADAIRDGSLLPGTRLPTHRALSAENHISLATATRVYAELESMGLTSGETGRGTFVREISLLPGLGIDQVVISADIVDLNFNYPALPQQADMLREALRHLSTSGDIESLLRYQPHAGKLSEREAIASWLSGMGFTPSAENVLIVNGAQHGLAITVMGLLKPGDVIAVDALTYPGFKALADLYRLELAPVPVTPSGPDFEALRQLCQRRHVRAIYTMPTLHNPLGWVLNNTQRHKLVKIARRHDLLIIEDAAYAYQVRNAPSPLAFIAPERTVYVTGFAKNIATGLRVGAVVSPAPFRQSLEHAIRATTWNTPSVMTSIVCGWLQDGTVKRLEGLKRREARRRQAVARELLSPLKFISHPGAWFLWLPLPEEIRAENIVRKLAEEGISISTAEPFCTTQNVPHAIRLALGSVSTEKLRLALIKIRKIIEYERDLY